MSDIESSKCTQVFEVEVDVPTQEFYVCFSGAGNYPGSRLFKKGFNHVSVMERIPLGFIAHDPNRYALDAYILPEVQTENFIKKFIEMRDDYTIVRVIKRANGEDGSVVRFGLQSCVTTVAYILGMKLPFYCATPHQLYKRIMKCGDGIVSAKEITNGIGSR